jgi:uncharacterized delta-60 repeat protein
MFASSGGIIMTSTQSMASGWKDRLHAASPRAPAVCAALLLGPFLQPASVNAAEAGDLDLTFHDDGLVTTDFGGEEYGQAVTLQPDGKIVVAGGFTDGTGFSGFALARYWPNGRLDSSFSGDGLVISDFGRPSSAMAVAMQRSRIVAAGVVTRQVEENVISEPVIARYWPNGSRDTSFGRNGLVLPQFEGLSVLFFAMAVQPDCKILLAGVADDGAGEGRFIVVRYLQDGALDTGFGQRGVVLTNIGVGDAVFALALQRDGKIVAAGSGGPQASGIAVARYLRNGTLDTTFGGDGSVTTPLATVNQVPYRGISAVVQADGKIVVGAFILSSDSRFALLRYGPNGTLDPAFDGDGVVLAELDDPEPGRVGTGQHLTDIALQPDGKIIAAGFANFLVGQDGLRSVAVARFRASGALDTTFSGDGFVITHIGSGDSAYANGVVLQRDGKIVAAGQVRQASGASDFGLARYHGVSIEGLDSDADAVPDSLDRCANSVTSPTVVIDGQDSGVANAVLPNGCSIADQVEQCASDAQGHGQFVGCVGTVAREATSKGILRSWQQQALQDAAARSSDR